MSYQQPDISDQPRAGLPSASPSAVTVPDLALVVTFRPAATLPLAPAAPGARAGGPLIGLLRYVMLSPPAGGGSAEQAQAVQAAMAYLVSRADALVRAGKGHLIGEAEQARNRAARESDGHYAPPPRSFVGETIADAVGYLCPAIGEEAASRAGRPGGTGPREVIAPGFGDG